MKKFIFICALLLLAQQVYANTYVSPERYAVNESDYMDYTRVAPPKPLNVDTLEDDRFQAPNLVEKDFGIGKDETKTEDKTVKSDKKSKKQEKEELEPYQKRLSYKFAKWWVDQRYKREEAHHGALHEIKVEKRMLYEQKEQEKQEKSESTQTF